jgi:hypothetical protein
MRALVIAALAFMIAACSAGNDMTAAEQGVAATHKAFSSGQFATVYDGSSEEMKSSVTRDQFVKMFAPIYAKTGAYRSGKTVGWNVKYGTDGNYAVLNHEAQFEHGTGKEEFVFRLKDGKAILAGYHVKTDVPVAQ